MADHDDGQAGRGGLFKGDEVVGLELREGRISGRCGVGVSAGVAQSRKVLRHRDDPGGSQAIGVGDAVAGRHLAVLAERPVALAGDGIGGAGGVDDRGQIHGHSERFHGRTVAGHGGLHLGGSPLRRHLAR